MTSHPDSEFRTDLSRRQPEHGIGFNILGLPGYANTELYLWLASVQDGDGHVSPNHSWGSLVRDFHEHVLALLLLQATNEKIVIVFSSTVFSL